jgi:hypothetical protein
MPEDRSLWREYNYRAAGDRALTTWWMNALQGLPVEDPVLVTVGPRGWGTDEVVSDVVARIDYTHPASPPEAVAARPAMERLALEGPIYFCGSYLGSTGSNECAIASATRAADALLTRFALPQP